MLRKYGHLSNRKENKRLRKLEKRRKKKFGEIEKIETLQTGTVISISRTFDKLYPGPPIFGIVINLSSDKKKWKKTYQILTENGVWEVKHSHLEQNYKVRKHED